MAIGTGNISLQDVVDYLGAYATLPGGTLYDGNGDYTLDRCFRNTYTFGFDSANYGYSYNVSYSGNSLYNFKNYNHDAEQSRTFTYLGNVLSGPQSLTVGSNAGSITLTIDTNGMWTIAGSSGSALPSWVSATPTGIRPPGQDNITISFSQNTGASDRVTTIYAFGEVPIRTQTPGSYSPSMLRLVLTQQGIA